MDSFGFHSNGVGYVEVSVDIDMESWIRAHERADRQAPMGSRKYQKEGVDDIAPFSILDEVK
jgi:hypothetical protein